MEKCEMAEFSKLLCEIGEMYGKTVSPVLIELYWECLRDYAMKEVSNALSSHISDVDEGKYFPRPAHILKFLKRTDDLRASEAWSSVCRAMRQVGAYKTVCFDDPVIHKVITEMGGWSNLCHVNMNELYFRKSQFEKLYKSYSNWSPKYFIPRLSGIFNSQDTVRIRSNNVQREMNQLEYKRGVM